MYIYSFWYWIANLTSSLRHDFARFFYNTQWEQNILIQKWIFFVGAKCNLTQFNPSSWLYKCINDPENHISIMTQWIYLLVYLFMKSMNEIERSFYQWISFLYNFMSILTLIKAKIIHIFHFIQIHFLLLRIYFPCFALGPRKTKHVCTNLIDICC